MDGTEETSGTAAERRPDPAGTTADGTKGLDPEVTTVHEALHQVPGADEVFQRFGLDCCCGGQLPVATAAERHGVDLDRLLDALDGASTEG